MQDALARRALFVFDSCNASAGGRAHYTADFVAAAGGARIALLSYVPSDHPGVTGDSGASSARDERSGDHRPRSDHRPAGDSDPSRRDAPGSEPPPAADRPRGRRSTAHRELLLERTDRRRGHPTFPSERAQREACLDATMAAMEWPARGELGATILRCDPLRAPPLVQTLGEVFGHFFWWAPPARDDDEAAGGAEEATLWEAIGAARERKARAARGGALRGGGGQRGALRLSITADGPNRVMLTIAELWAIKTGEIASSMCVGRVGCSLCAAWGPRGRQVVEQHCSELQTDGALSETCAACLPTGCGE
eukprot:5226657-Prymnesium_polylepis.1